MNVQFKFNSLVALSQADCEKDVNIHLFLNLFSAVSFEEDRECRPEGQCKKCDEKMTEQRRYHFRLLSLKLRVGNMAANVMSYSSSYQLKLGCF